MDKRLSKQLTKWNPDNNLHGLFDSALIETLWLDIEDWQLSSTPLYRGDSQLIAPAIPYLITLDSEKDPLACEMLLSHIGKNAFLN